MTTDIVVAPRRASRSHTRAPAEIDLSTVWGRFKAYWKFVWGDHAFVRLLFQNEYPLCPEMSRANQPWPFQLKRWRDRGVKTVINLRGGVRASFHILERDACDRLGLKLLNFTLRSRRALTAEQVLAAKTLFESIEYPAVFHCKSGADRAGLMSVLYCHLRLGQPIEQALAQLDLRYGHIDAGRTGVLGHMFRSYLARRSSPSQNFLDWVMAPGYCPASIEADFRPRRWGTLLTDKLLRRE